MNPRLVGCLIVACACEGGLITQAAPRAEARDTDISVEFHVAVDPSDELRAGALGWLDGVPHARVMVLRNGTATWDTLMTDGVGRVTRLLGAGRYRLYAERVLTDGEAGLAGKRRALGDGRSIDFAGSTAIELRLHADSAGGLVISEIGHGTPPPWETNGSYFGGLFFEIFNNGTETRYLDGILFGATSIPYRFTLPTPCPGTESTRHDSTSIHVREVLAFPGTGTDYPIEPGETRLVAWQAIDHRPAHSTLPDLTHADFEVASGGGADNPDVPNMRDAGLSQFLPQNLLGTNVYFLAAPQDPRTLPTSFRDANGQAYARVPTESLEDVAVLWRLWPERDAENPPCHPMISPSLHRYEGPLWEIGFAVDPTFEAVRGLQRRALRRDTDGRIILFDTNTSAVDFEYALKTPGWVPEPEP